MKAVTVTLNPALDRTMFFDAPFRAGALNRAAKSVENAGGKGINVSRALNILGSDASALCFLGGETGRHLASLLAAEGIACRPVETAAPTRINTKMIDPDGVCTEANESGGPITAAEWEKFTDLLRISTENAQVLILSGSIPPGLGKDVYRAVGNEMAKKGVRVVLDCDGEALRYGMEAHPWLIKPNLYELSGYAGHPIETVGEAVEIAARLFVENGTRVLCTMGGDGSFYYGDEGLVRVGIARVPVRGFTGAGDTCLAAFLYEYDRTGDPRAALRFAAGAAAAKVACEGTAMPTRAEMESLAGVVGDAG